MLQCGAARSPTAQDAWQARGRAASRPPLGAQRVGEIPNADFSHWQRGGDDESEQGGKRDTGGNKGRGARDPGGKRGRHANAPGAKEVLRECRKGGTVSREATASLWRKGPCGKSRQEKRSGRHGQAFR